MKTVNERFDIFEWDAPVYENFEGIAHGLHWLNLCNKKLKAIYIIGDCMEDREYWERSAWKLTVMEPVQLVFEGGISVEILVSSARERISSATTAKPLPASPALAASIEAFKARRLVWEEMFKMESVIPCTRCTFCTNSLTVLEMLVMF